MYRGRGGTDIYLPQSDICYTKPLVFHTRKDTNQKCIFQWSLLCLWLQARFTLNHVIRETTAEITTRPNVNTTPTCFATPKLTSVYVQLIQSNPDKHARWWIHVQTAITVDTDIVLTAIAFAPGFNMPINISVQEAKIIMLVLLNC
ncbi:uncharacterized protein LOC132737914 [Ruditapes philippinarum]|uniref:uncharacterized protein LOC132737914 n=1 Tax=Ruditapes philippinarum TaxID=129788 RepID=UPI00295A708F|nr:uncharacterized protein LOC132737914 [Ruditapes philippinarum]